MGWTNNSHYLIRLIYWRVVYLNPRYIIFLNLERGFDRKCSKKQDKRRRKCRQPLISSWKSMKNQIKSILSSHSTCSYRNKLHSITVPNTPIPPKWLELALQLLNQNKNDQLNKISDIILHLSAATLRMFLHLFKYKPNVRNQETIINCCIKSVPAVSVEYGRLNRKRADK